MHIFNRKKLNKKIHNKSISPSGLRLSDKFSHGRNFPGITSMNYIQKSCHHKSVFCNEISIKQCAFFLPVLSLFICSCPLWYSKLGSLCRNESQNTTHLTQLWSASYSSRSFEILMKMYALDVHSSDREVHFCCSNESLFSLGSC